MAFNRKWFLSHHISPWFTLFAWITFHCLSFSSLDFSHYFLIWVLSLVTDICWSHLNCFNDNVVWLNFTYLICYCDQSHWSFQPQLRFSVMLMSTLENSREITNWSQSFMIEVNLSWSACGFYHFPMSDFDHQLGLRKWLTSCDYFPHAKYLQENQWICMLNDNFLSSAIF